MADSKKLLFLNRKPPYSSMALKESLDAALVTASFNQEVSLLFMGDGVFQLLDQQKAEAIESKHHGAMFAGLELYDIDRVYVAAESLKERHLDESDLIMPVQLLNQEAVHVLLQQQDAVLSF